MSAGPEGFDTLTGAGTGSPEGPGPGGPPVGIRTTGPDAPAATRIVLVRHGEAVCNVSGVCGGPVGCTGLTDRGRAQVAVLRDRLTETGELAGTDVLYSSVLPRAVETARILAPALAGPDGAGSGEPVQECGFCELHPGDADGLDWAAFSARFGNPDWDVDPGREIAPGGRAGPVSSTGCRPPWIAWRPATPARWSWWPAMPAWSRRHCWPSCRWWAGPRGRG